MAQSLYRKYFNIVPINNITTFSVSSGVDQISFLIPPLAGAALSTRDLVLSGRLLISKDDGTAYELANTENASWDSVNGAHNLIARVDINSQGGGGGNQNALIEQRRQYPLINKYRRGVLSENDLVAGKYSNQQLCSNSSNGARNFLHRPAGAAGAEFAIQLNTGFLMDNDQQINLSSANSIIVKLYLNDISNALFSVTPGTGDITSSWNIQLQNVELFGRYNFVSQPLLDTLNRVNFRKINDMMSVVQSSNDTMSNQPMVSSVHKVIKIYQPNATTANNVAKNNTACNQLVGLKQYQLSNNGTQYPYDYPIDIEPSMSNLPVGTGNQVIGGVTGSAEQAFMLINSLNGNFPPVHSLVNGKNMAQGVEDQITGNNVNTLAVDGVGCDYSYGFEGFTIPMTSTLIQTALESSLLTNEAIVPTSARDQSATQNYFVEYDSTLTYAGMSVSS
tara:strand:- start:651 stop:1997 length:1347 start_codon:yes stop_codon:yes gene_type:complete